MHKTRHRRNRKRGRGEHEEAEGQTGAHQNAPEVRSGIDKEQRTDSGQDHKNQAAQFFRCTPKQVSSFTVPNDPFNPGNSYAGYICRNEGNMGGALFITHVNGRAVDPPQAVYGTPKLKYPYSSKVTGQWKTFPDECRSYYVATKWNGMNVLFFKYCDPEGTVYVSAKSKGSSSLADGSFGNFLTSTLQVLGFDQGPPEGGLWKHLPAVLSPLQDPRIQSLSFELCGNKEPHLVKYDFELDLQPLFSTTFQGQISPLIVDPKDGGDVVHPFDQAQVVQVCKEYQERDFALNEAYRKEHGLKHKYEYNHFATEGRVLYLMDANHHLIKRTMYKVKPRDIEEVHWGNFNATMEGRVREAVAKIATREKPMTAASIQAELDMGPKEWGRFGNDVMNAVKQLRQQQFWSPPRGGPLALMLIGLQSSGKAAVAKKLEKHGWLRFSEEDFKGHVECKAHMLGVLSEQPPGERPRNVVVDASILNPSHRKAHGWLNTLHAAGYWNVHALLLERDVPNAKAGGPAKRELQPQPQEDFQRVTVAHTDADVEAFLRSFA